MVYLIKIKKLKSGSKVIYRWITISVRLYPNIPVPSLIALEPYCNTGSPDTKIRRAQADRVRQEFIQSILRFQDMERGYAKKYRKQVERQIRIGKKKRAKYASNSVLIFGYCSKAKCN